MRNFSVGHGKTTVASLKELYRYKEASPSGAQYERRGGGRRGGRGGGGRF
jgi:hypothetical protein